MAGPHIRRRRFEAGVMVIVLLVAGCGGDDPAPDVTTPAAGPTTAASPADDAATTPESDATATADDLDGLTFTIGESFWHSGFAVTLESGTVEAQRDTLDEVTGYLLTLAGTFENLGDSPSWFDPEVAVVQDGTTFPSTQLGQVPDVPSGLVGDGQLTFPIEEGFDPDQAMLVVGAADQARAEVPLGPDAGALVALEPELVDVTGTMSVALLDMEVVGGELRWDIPQRHDQVAPGTRALTLFMTATSRKRGNWNTFADSFSLTTPDGTSLPADDAVLDSLPGNESGLTTEGQWVRFVVDEDAAGDHTLRMLLPDFWLGEDETVAEASLDFTLGG